MVVVGLSSATGSAAVTAVVSRTHVPHLTTFEKISYTEAADIHWTLSSLFLAPTRSQLSMAFRDLVAEKAWKSFTFAYLESSGM